ncbi:hypothetical protein RND81_02G126600 [Saponaria officinalis]|uniref:RING-type domain-containing protein n=1 Tax=Saponaria officinalis TaxID=3572 RepID=A0AAW1MMG4_SAPOF
MVDPTNTSSFSKTICSICYEDLKPIVEDLQCVSICGHVFHELCLQQWFEYCTNSKKQSCPVCKQGCTKKAVCRLYFQSVGDAVLTQCQSENPRSDREHGDCPEILRVEVKRLESKVSNLNSALDLQQKVVTQLTDELHICKEQLSKEVILKNEALRQRESIQAILQTKSSELVRSNIECTKLQEKNKALFKELAAIKLVSDCNLEEEEIVKLASVGSDGNIQDAIDVLKKSLVIRNKSYKDLMAKCNSLGRGEARYHRKLEKAKDKIVKLKLSVQDLEKIIEARDAEVLRLKAFKISVNDVPILNRSTNSSSILKNSFFSKKGQFSSSVVNLDDDEDDIPIKAVKSGENDANVSKCHDDGRSTKDQETTRYESFIDEECEVQKSDTPNGNEESHQNCGSSKPVDSGFDKYNMKLHNQRVGLSTSADLRSDVIDECSAPKEATGLVLQDIRQIQPSAHTNAESSSFIPLVEPGDRCFAGGLLGPDGGNRYLGKWCKRAPNNATKGAMHGSSNVTDSLIAVGADGRGGKVKVLRSLNQTGTDTTRESTVPAKRFKPGGKPSSLQTRGCLQIEHFFAKAHS